MTGIAPRPMPTAATHTPPSVAPPGPVTVPVTDPSRARLASTPLVTVPPVTVTRVAPAGPDFPEYHCGTTLYGPSGQAGSPKNTRYRPAGRLGMLKSPAAPVTAELAKRPLALSASTHRAWPGTAGDPPLTCPRIEPPTAMAALIPRVCRRATTVTRDGRTWPARLPPRQGNNWISYRPEFRPPITSWPWRSLRPNPPACAWA